MTLPASFPLSMSQINVELGRAPNATVSLAESAVRTLAGVPSGSISFSNLLGKASMSATGVDSGLSYNSSGSGGSANSFPSVNVSGGQAPYTYSWSFTSNPQSASLANATGQTPTVSRPYTANSVGSYSATLQCVVTDNLGTQRTVTNVTASADWEP